MNITIGDLVGHPFSPPESVFGMVLEHRHTVLAGEEYRIRWFRSYDGKEWDSWARDRHLLEWKKKLADHVASW